MLLSTEDTRYASIGVYAVWNISTLPELQSPTRVALNTQTGFGDGCHPITPSRANMGGNYLLDAYRLAATNKLLAIRIAS